MTEFCRALWWAFSLPSLNRLVYYIPFSFNCQGVFQKKIIFSVFLHLHEQSEKPRGKNCEISQKTFRKGLTTVFHGAIIALALKNEEC